MSQVLDYSAGWPGAAAIAHAGYVGAVRYIGFPSNRKCTNAAELRDFTLHGLGMALVFEQSITNWKGGRAAGERDARLGRNHANAIGFPSNRPIYMAVDTDVVSAADFNIMLDYLRGANSVLGGPGSTGVYGEADVVDRCRQAGVAEYQWQTKAWSRGRTTTANLLQLIGSVYVSGIACDANNVLTQDWGQHNIASPEEDDMTPDQSAKLDAVFNAFWRTDGTAYGVTVFDQLNRMEAQNVALVDAVARVTSNPDITPDALRQMITDAVAQHVQITGTINIGPATQEGNPS